MGIGEKLASMLSGNVADSVTKIVGLFKVPPEQVEEHAFELQKIQADLVGKAMENAQAEIEAASANIQAEEKSGDAYTERARPTFLYLVYIILAFNFLVVPIYQIVNHLALSLIVLPHELYWLFGSGYLGYVGASHWSDFMNAPGESKLELPFGMKMSNTSPGSK